MSADDLARAWVDAGGSLAGHDASAWSQTLRDALKGARESWPTIELDDAAALPVLVSAVDGGPPTRIAELDVPHLFLVAACLAGDEHAASCFMRLCRPEIELALGRFSAEGTFREDVTDDVFEKMLVALPSRPARLAEYRGQGSLARWVRVVAVRSAIDRLRGRGRREHAVDDPALLDGLDREDDPELRYLRERYSEQFRAAFEHAVASLDDRERRLLRERVVHGLGIVQLAALHETSKSTVARWVAAARARLVAAAHAYLQEHLDVGPDELRSAMRLVSSRLHISVARILAAPE